MKIEQSTIPKKTRFFNIYQLIKNTIHAMFTRYDEMFEAMIAQYDQPNEGLNQLSE